MGLFGGSSSSKQSSSTINEVDNRVYDFSGGAGGGGTSLNEINVERSKRVNLTNYQTDHGAIKAGADLAAKGFQLGYESLKEASNTNHAALDLAKDSLFYNNESQVNSYNFSRESLDKSFNFSFESLKEILGFTKGADQRSNLVFQNAMTRQDNSNQKHLSAVVDVAKSVKSNGQTDIAKNMQNTVLAVAAGAVVIVGIVAFAKVGK